MTTSFPSMEQLAEQIKVALHTGDTDAYSELLVPNVQWGPPGDTESGCHNRHQVLQWYKRGRELGVRATVIESLVRGDKILIGMVVTGNDATRQTDGAANRWQVLTVARGTIVDIRGFEDRDDALSTMH